MELARFFFPYFRPYMKRVTLAMLLAIPLAGVKGATVWLTQNLVNQVLVNKDEKTLYLIPAALIGLYLLNMVIRFFHYYMIRSSADRVVVTIRTDILKKLNDLHLEFFSKHPAGDLISRSLADVVFLGMGINLIGSFIREPIIFIGLLGYALYLNWKLTLFCFILLPLFIWIFNVTGKHVRRYGKNLQEALGGSTRIVHETIGGARVIRSFNLEKFTDDRFQVAQNIWLTNQLKWGKLEEFTRPLIELIGSIAISLVLLVGGYQVIGEEINAGELIAFLTAIMLLQDPIRKLNDANLKLSQALAAADRVKELLEIEPEIKDPENPITLTRFKDSISLVDVSFKYESTEKNKDILSNINLHIKKGESVALVGPSGAGKTTLVNLVPRLIDVSSGKIEIDGIDTRDFSLNSLRSKIAVVSQDTFLFNDSIRMNVCCGKPDATEEELIDALKAANALEFVSALPKGVDTLIGDQGMKLSGGQRQRITIARAILSNSPILILDEATSSLDNESEKLVQAALDNLMTGKTTLVIAHRLSTIEKVDRIIVLLDGKIVEVGNHTQLLDKKGTYWKLARAGGLVS